MPGGGRSFPVVMRGLQEPETIIMQTAKSPREKGVVPDQEIPPELVYHNDHDQSRPFLKPTSACSGHHCHAEYDDRNRVSE